MKNKYCDTNEKVVLLMIEKLEMPTKLPIGFRVLEPESGNGVIVNMLPIPKIFIEHHVDFCELDARKASITKEKTNAIFKEFDFMDLSRSYLYDRIIAVPPFDELKWKHHTIKMHEHLKAGGKMVVLLPVNCMLEADFVNWCLKTSATFTKIDLCACDYFCDTGILEVTKQ